MSRFMPALRGALAVVLFAALLLPLARSGPARAEPAAAVSRSTALQQPQAPGGSRREVPGLRTGSSRTFVEPDGSHTAELYAGSVNYRDANGDYQPIDNTLVGSDVTGYAFRNKANAYTVSLPPDLASPVRVERGGAWVSFALEQARGRGSVAGNVATFAEVLPGVTVVYAALGDALKETIILRDARAPSEFSFDVRTSPGLRANGDSAGGIVFTDSEGRRQLAFAPPFMLDSSGTAAGFSRAVTMDARPTAEGFRIELKADPAWLASGERRFPVLIDPTLLTLPDESYCSISSAFPDDDCYGLEVGFDGTDRKRSLIRFDLAAIPGRSQILRTSLELYLERASTSTPTTIDLHRLTRAFSGASWNTSDGTSSWSMPGGDFDAAVAASAQAGAGPPNAVRWHPTGLVQEWVNGAPPNYGFLLKQAGEATINVLRFTHRLSVDPIPKTLPKLTVTYSQRLGVRRTYTFESQRLNDRMSLGANVASGNLVLQADDVSIAGTGLPLELDRYYNSRTADVGSVGARWVLSGGADVRLEENLGDLIYVGPSGFAVTFTRNGDGTYSSPSGIDATLTKDADTGYTIAFHQSGEKYKFGPNTGNPERLTAHTDRNGNRIAYAYDVNKRLTSVTDTQGRVTTVSYTAAGHISELRDATARRWRYAHDASNRPITYTDPAGKITRYEYAADGDLTKITDPQGRITRLAYDTFDRVTSIVRETGGGTGPTTAFTYNAGNTIATDPRGNPTTYHYDAEGRVTKVVDALGRDRSVTYNSNSDVLTETDALGKTTQFAYDDKNNLVSAQSPSGARDSWTYQLTGAHPYYPASATDAQARRTSYEYDARGNPNALVNAAPTQNHASATYNANGTIATSTDFKGTITRYTYDAKGNRTGVDHPAPLGDESYAYDSLSRVTTATDGKGQRTTYTYDTLDRLTKITFHDASTITYVYDADGNLTSMVDNTGTTTFTYDALNRLTKETLPGSKTNTYTYDAASHLASFADAGGTVTYASNQADELTTLTEPAGPGSRQTTFLYDRNGNRTQTNYPNGVSLYVTYDSDENLLTIVGKKPASGLVLTSYAYSYIDSGGSARDLRQSVSDGLSGVTTSYAYDELNRLLSASGGGQSYSYAYDANSNRSSQTGSGASTSYAHNAADELTAAGPVGYAYDANGNELSNSAGRAAAYNAKDQTTSLTPPGGTAIPMTYTGAAQFRRVTRGGTSFTSGLLGLMREDSTSYTRDDDGFLIALRSPGGNHYPLLDGLGSVTKLTDAAGSVAATYSYEPFGKAVSSTGTVSNPYRWLGALGVYFDSTTGLYKMGTRYYDPTLGRFTQVDPVEGGSANRYDYAGQDPINNSDLDGMRCWRCKLRSFNRNTQRVGSLARRAGSVLARRAARTAQATRAALLPRSVLEWALHLRRELRNPQQSVGLRSTTHIPSRTVPRARG